MYQRVFAFDFDGTLAENDRVPPATQSALWQLHTAGYALFLVTARRFESFDLGPLGQLFTGCVWENGAVLHHLALNEVYLPFGQIDPGLVEALRAAGIPIEQGRAAVFTRIPHDEEAWRVLGWRCSGEGLAYDKGSVIISPPGTAKGAGLERLLDLCGYSPRNLVSFGDGESDLSLLSLGEVGVAVANAVSSLKDAADLVTTETGPAGVLEALQTYWLNGARHTTIRARRRERPIPLGNDDAGTPVSLSGETLTSGNLGVFGDSCSGKSWVTGLLAEGMHRAGYQVLLIDPEGDFRGMRSLPGIVALDGDGATLPAPGVVTALLETVKLSVVLDLCAYPLDRRESYLVELLGQLRALKSHKFRPHWIVLEESQYFLPSDGGPVGDALLPMLADGGWAFVSYRPDQLASPVLAALDRCLLTRLTEPHAVRTLCQWFNWIEESPASIPHGHVWLCGERLVRLRSSARRVAHIRHLHKYLDSPLPPHKHFSFRDERGFLGMTAASLPEFAQCLSILPPDSLVYHAQRGDFTAWAESALGDGILAARLRKLCHRPIDGEALRQALVQCIEEHSGELQALHATQPA